ncbi:protein-S-isoprenylcysteine O-methyltransferase [Acidovorax cavernicola]|uniref:Isoprenylcysteine carboxylmethyltransferase family protein n=1 Tax=Acidovorax cavernicola TaxID=1675792 RepID=A0A9X8D1L8_9BURK|nr:protein-S-isoprenylcysteine O-methyltransferase [Acidovorax cavernicola]RIX76324.1 isoprenylcysteine carboxylmethyltransferase family protein [Acidovorax cavernicola]
MNLQPSHLIFAAGTVAYMVIRAAFQRHGASGAKAHSRADARDRLLIVIVGLCQMGLPALLLLTPWLDAANYTRPEALTWVGTVVMAGALWLFWRSHADLGASWSVTLELNQDHRLVTQGVYRRIRHPMYASFFAMAIGQALLLSNWIAGGAALLAISLLYIVRTPNEERMMLESFGDEYRDYMRRTGGILPRATTP